MNNPTLNSLKKQLDTKISRANDLFDACKLKNCDGKCAECQIYKELEKVFG